MLLKLSVSNLALVRKADIDFENGLNIISGETGAGKSILIDGLMLLLGGRYDKSLLRFGSGNGYVEGVFAGNLSGVLSRIGFEDEDMLIINRRFNEDGKNEIRINGKIATLSMLKTVTSGLVDIYGQNEYQSLVKKAEHIKLLDYYCRDELQAELINYKNLRTDYFSVVKKLDELGSVTDREKNIDFLSYQIDEIEKADIQKDEEESLLVKRKLAANLQRASESLGASCELLADITGKIAEIKKNMRFMSGIDSTYNALYDRLESALIELEDINETLTYNSDNMKTDCDLDSLEERLAVVRAIKRKYGDVEQIREFLNQAKQRLALLSDCDALYESLQKEKQKSYVALKTSALKLSDIRRSSAAKLEREIMEQLNDLGMKNSRFKIVFAETPEQIPDDMFSANGIDDAEFYLSPNAGQPLQPLLKIISGGEMSRFMLALKVVAGEMSEISTMIFDEIDTGISGVVGQEVAKKLCDISKFKQVICVTHLPQIAAMADNHLFISKHVENEETFTTLGRLDYDGQIREISRLSGSVNISSSSFKNAEEMKSWSDKYKQKQ